MKLNQLPKRIIAAIMVGVLTLLGAGTSVLTGWAVSNGRSDAASFAPGQNSVNGTYSRYDNYYVYRVMNGKPLFTATGVNDDVATDISRILAGIEAQKRATWYQGGARAEGDQYFERTADHMSQWVLRENGVPQSEWASDDLGYEGPDETSGRIKSGGVFVKLFDSTGLANGVAKDIADQWFQIVYTSGETAAESIITFYMAENYKGTTTFHNSGQQYPGYSVANIRTNATSGINTNYNTLKAAFTKLDGLAVSPSAALPGAWQSQAFQSGHNNAGTNGTGQSGYTFNSSLFALQNGMNAVGTTADNGGAYMSDKMWLPSAFETIYMGQNKDIAQADGRIKAYDLGNSSMLNGFGRTGLWRLNGYDRSFLFNGTTQETWTRSGSNGATPGRVISFDGGGSAMTITGPIGVRTALHLNLSAWKYTQPAWIHASSSGSASGATVTSSGTTAESLEIDATTPGQATITFDATNDHVINKLIISGEIVTANIHPNATAAGLAPWITDIEGIEYKAYFTDNAQKVVLELKYNISETVYIVATNVTIIEDLTKKLNDALNRIEELEQENQEKDSTITDLTKEINDILEAIEADTSMSAIEKIAALKNEIRSLNEQLEQIAILQGRIEQLEAFIASIAAALGKGEEEILEEIENLQSTIAGQDSTIQTMTETINDINGKLAELYAALDVETQADALAEIARLQNQISDLTTAKDNLQSDFDDLEIAMALLTTDKEAADAEIIRLITQISEDTAEYNAIIEGLQTQLATIFEALDNSEDLQGALIIIIKLRETIEILTQGDLATQIIALTNNLAALTGDYNAALAEIERMTGDISTLTGENSVLKGKVAELEEFIALLSQALQGDGADVTRLLSDIEDLLSEMSELNIANEELEAILSALQEKVTELEQGLADLSPEDANKGLDPFLIGLIIAACILGIGIGSVVTLVSVRPNKKDITNSTDCVAS